MSAEVGLPVDLVYENLCVKDRRNPLWESLYGYDDEENIPEPRVGCMCDNCFYGLDRLALEILRLRDEATQSQQEQPCSS